MRASIVVALSFLLLAGVVRADDAATPRQRAESFLARVGKGEVAPAYDELLVGSSMPTLNPQSVDSLKRQTESSLHLYGKTLGFELESEKKLGTSLVRLTYVQKREQRPVVWRFWFYKPLDAWFVDSVSFNDTYAFFQGD